MTTKDGVNVSLVLKEDSYKTLKEVSKAEGRSIDAEVDHILCEHFDDERGEGE